MSIISAVLEVGNEKGNKGTTGRMVRFAQKRE